MAVISVLRKNENNVTKARQNTIRNINFNGVDYHFAKSNEVTDGVCENAVNEPIIDMQIQGNSIQDGIPALDAPIEIQSVGERTKNLVDIPNLSSSTKQIKIDCYLTETFIVSCQEYPTLIANDSGAEISIWRLMFTCLDGTSKYIVDDGLKGVGTATTKITTTEDNPVVSITYRGIYIREGEYKDIQIEYGETVTDYEPYGYKLPIKIGGKNLVDVSSDTNTLGYLTATGEIVSHSAIKYTDYISTGNANQITFSGMGSNGMTAPATCFYDQNKTFISGVAFVGSGEKTIDIPENARYFRTCFRTSYTQFMVEFNSTATDYEPYIEPITSNIYLNEPLRMINDVADVLDYKNKKIIRNVGSIICDGTENWSLYNTSKGFLLSNSIFPDGQPVMCNLFVNSQSNVQTLAIRKNYANIYVYGVQDYYATVEEWTAFLAENNMEVIGQLVTPTEETIELPTIETLDGTTTIEIQTELPPTSASFTYWKQI